MSRGLWGHRRETSLHRIFIFFCKMLQCRGGSGAVSAGARVGWGSTSTGPRVGPSCCAARDPFQQHRHPASALISSLLPEAVGFFPFLLYFPPSKEVIMYQGGWSGRAGEDADPAHAASLSSAPRQFVSCNDAVKF